jgi:hypothetical protein
VSALKALAGGAATGSFFGCFALANAGAPGLQKACPGAPALGDHAVGAGRVSAVNERLELTLDDGRLLRITGLDPPRPTPDGPDLDVDSSLKLAGWLVGKDIVFRLDEARPDRWGRLAAQVFAPAGASPSPLLAVAPAALDAGLARFEPGPAAHPCRAALLAAEAAARAAALGLWADPYYAVIPSGDHGAFPEKAGTSIIVEGRVTGVAQDAFRQRFCSDNAGDGIFRSRYCNAIQRYSAPPDLMSRNSRDRRSGFAASSTCGSDRKLNSPVRMRSRR